jgi:hypothetical protein
VGPVPQLQEVTPEAILTGGGGALSEEAASTAEEAAARSADIMDAAEGHTK